MDGTLQRGWKMCHTQARREKHQTKREGTQLFQDDIVQISAPLAQTQVVTSQPIQDWVTEVNALLKVY